MGWHTRENIRSNPKQFLSLMVSVFIYNQLTEILNMGHYIPILFFKKEVFFLPIMCSIVGRNLRYFNSRWKQKRLNYYHNSVCVFWFSNLSQLVRHDNSTNNNYNNVNNNIQPMSLISLSISLPTWLTMTRYSCFTGARSQHMTLSTSYGWRLPVRNLTWPRLCVS